MSSMQISVGVGKEAACLALEEEKRETHKWVITEIHFGQLCLFIISVTFHHSLLMLDEWWNVTEIVNRHS